MSGLSGVPQVGFGTFIGIEADRIADETERFRVVEESVFNALKEGFRHLDCAKNYGNLKAVGRALEKAYGELDIRREDIWITCKGSPEDTLDEILADLRTDHLDLYLAHHPVFYDSESHLVDSWRSMNELVRTKKTRFIGVSNHYRQHLKPLLRICKEAHLSKPFANEIETHPLDQEPELVAYCQKNDIHVIAQSPLAYNLSSVLLDSPALRDVASELDVSSAQVALAWNLKRGVSVIPKARSAEHVRENFRSAELISKLTEDHMERLGGLDWGDPVTETAEQFKRARVDLKSE